MSERLREQVFERLRVRWRFVNCNLLESSALLKDLHDQRYHPVILGLLVRGKREGRDDRECVRRLVRGRRDGERVDTKVEMTENVLEGRSSHGLCYEDK